MTEVATFVYFTFLSTGDFSSTLKIYFSLFVSRQNAAIARPNNEVNNGMVQYALLLKTRTTRKLKT